jgi:hypothetical protein
MYYAITEKEGSISNINIDFKRNQKLNDHDINHSQDHPIVNELIRHSQHYQ